jgi:hypothetical protein
MSPCALLVLGRLPSGACRPPASATRLPRRLPCSCYCLPAADVRHSAHSTSGLPCRDAGLPAPATSPPCPPGPPAVRPPCSARRSGLPARLGTAVPPASLPPCLARWRLPGSLLHCSAAHVAACLRARLLNCSVLTCCVGRYCSAAAVHQSIHLSGRCAAVRGASHPALRASGASLLDQLHCSPGSSALCDCAGYCVCLLSLICLG